MDVARRAPAQILHLGRDAQRPVLQLLIVLHQPNDDFVVVGGLGGIRRRGVGGGGRLGQHLLRHAFVFWPCRSLPIPSVRRVDLRPISRFGRQKSRDKRA